MSFFSKSLEQRLKYKLHDIVIIRVERDVYRRDIYPNPYVGKIVEIDLEKCGEIFYVEDLMGYRLPVYEEDISGYLSSENIFAWIMQKCP